MNSSLQPAPAQDSPVRSDLPLYVDLDGSLLRSDLLVESALQLLKRRPDGALSMVRWLREGKARLKAGIAAEVDVAVDLLPYDEAVVDFVRDARAQGRRVVLATASHRKYAQAVADHLGLFDGVIATEDSLNMSGTNKLAAIQRDAAGAFDYIGNDDVDLAIWRHAAGAVVVSSRTSLVRRAGEVAARVQHIAPKAPGLADWMRALRLHQWAKNLLIFLPALPLLERLSANAWLSLLMGFVCFGLCASSVYLLNDLLDLESDRRHTRKRLRPIPDGRLSLVRVALVVPLLLVLSLASAVLLLPWPFVAVLGAYWCATLAYSFVLKRRVLVDVMTLACLYTVRIIAGSAIILVPPSFWILVFGLFLFLSLAAAKRFVELSVALRRDGGRIAGRGYQVTDIPFVLALGVSSGLAAVMLLALYINDPAAGANLRRPYALWPICPLLLYWVARVWLKATRHELHDDPVVFAIKDRISQTVGLLCLLMVFLAARA